MSFSASDERVIKEVVKEICKSLNKVADGLNNIAKPLEQAIVLIEQTIEEER